MKLERIENGYAIFTDGNKIIAQKITKDAKDILEWQARNIPANNE